MANLFRCAGGGEDIKCIERPYDISKTYNAGDTVLYNGLLRICTANGVTGDFNESKWEVTTLEELLGENAGESATFVDYIASEYDPTHTYAAGDAILADNGEILKCLEDEVTGEFDNSKWSRDYLCNLSGNVNSNLMSKLIPCEYGAYGSSVSVTITKPSSFTSSTYTLLVFTSEDYRVSETYSISGATLLQTISGSRYASYYDQKYRMYSVSGNDVTISFTHGNTNAGLSYILIDKDLASMALATEPISYPNGNSDVVYVSCNMSDRRGYTYIDGGSLGYVCHLATPTNKVNFASYYTNIFTVYTLLEDGYVKMNRSGINQHGNTLILS